MNTTTVPANGIDIAYETFGEAGAPPVVLVMGLGTQMIAWPDELCELIAAGGRYVVRFDNRDVGLSTHLTDVRAPDVKDVILRRKRPPYTVEDMADDLIGLLDALELQQVHLVGASMGGFIAQTAALRAPERFASLTLIMTSTGSRLVGQAKPKLMARLLKRRAVSDRDSAVTAAAETFGLIGSRGGLFEQDHIRDVAGRSYDRAHDPSGYLRQLSAIVAQPDRTKPLTGLQVPTLVMHGLHDPLVAVSGGLALAKRIRGARFVGYSGMGHDLPRSLWPEFAREILQHTDR